MTTDHAATPERDSDYVDVTITCTVWDRAALWDRAREYIVEANAPNASGWVEADLALIGTRERPDVGACLIMLLDRSEHLDGADIEGSETDWQSDEDGDE